MSNSQLIKEQGQGYSKVYPLAYIQGISDANTGEQLSDILSSVNHIYIPYQNSISATRLAASPILRKKGLYLTYEKDNKMVTEFYVGSNPESDAEWVNDSNWEQVPDLAYLYDQNSGIPDGAILPQHLSSALWELLNEHHDIINLPDDEDLEQNCYVLRFKDREYRPVIASGKGSKILRRNWVNNVNVLTQDMVNESNTIYEVRYDFDLQGETITLLTNSSFRFMGGTINNGTVVMTDGDLINVRSFNEAGTATFNGTFTKGLILTFDDSVKFWNGTEWVGIATGGEIETITGAEVTNVTTTASQANATAKVSNGIVQFTFDIPRGEKGDRGDVGPQGPQGPMGPGGGEQGEPGVDGKSFATIDAFCESEAQPAAPTGGSYNFDDNIMTYPENWYSSVGNMEGVVWLSKCVFCSDGTNTGWSEPMKITGPQGAPGEDGDSYEYIYKLTTDVTPEPEKPESLNQDDYVPEGWEDNPRGISETYKVEWVCIRVRGKGAAWGDWTEPTIWSKWGERGKDGDGVEYIFTLTQGLTRPDTPTQSENVDEYIPPQGSNENPWTDDPQDVTAQLAYCWVSQRKEKDGVWGAWSKPSVWAHFGKDGTPPNWKTYVYKQSSIKPDKPTSTDLIPSGWKDYPDDPSGQWWQCVGLVDGVTNLVTEWSEVLPVNGKDGAGGARVEFRFAVNSSHVTAPELNRSSRTPSGWTTSFPTKSESQYMWMTSAEINANDDLVGQWNLPVCISGEQGPKGDTGPAGAEGTPGPAGIDGLPGVGLEARYCLGTEESYDGANPPGDQENPTGWQKSVPQTTDQKPYIWCIQGKLTYTRGSSDSVVTSYSWSAPFRLSGVNGIDGIDGVGRPGQTIYPAGIYSTTTSYTTTEYSAPYVIDTSDPEGRFYVLNTIMTWKGTEQGNKTPYEDVFPDGGTEKNPSASWEVFEHFEAIYAKIGVIPNALIGSFVYNGNWMYSQQGKTASGTPDSYEDHVESISLNFQKFEAATNITGVDRLKAFGYELAYAGSTYVTTGTKWEWTPNIAINANTGEAYYGASNIGLADDGTSLFKNDLNLYGDVKVYGGYTEIAESLSTNVLLGSTNTSNTIVVNGATIAFSNSALAGEKFTVIGDHRLAPYQRTSSGWSAPSHLYILNKDLASSGGSSYNEDNNLAIPVGAIYYTDGNGSWICEPFYRDLGTVSLTVYHCAYSASIKGYYTGYKWTFSSKMLKSYLESVSATSTSTKGFSGQDYKCFPSVTSWTSNMGSEVQYSYNTYISQTSSAKLMAPLYNYDSYSWITLAFSSINAYSNFSNITKALLNQTVLGNPVYTNDSRPFTGLTLSKNSTGITAHIDVTIVDPGSTSTEFATINIPLL